MTNRAWASKLTRRDLTRFVGAGALGVAADFGGHAVAQAGAGS